MKRQKGIFQIIRKTILLRKYIAIEAVALVIYIHNNIMVNQC